MRPGAAGRRAGARARALVAVLLAAALPACITFSDRAGLPVRTENIPRVQEGVTTRGEVLALFGPPTGTFDTDLLATVTRMGETWQAPATPGRIDDEVLVWQEVEVAGRFVFVPVLFFWGSSEITSRTLAVFFDAHDIVRHVAFREDRP